MATIARPSAASTTTPAPTDQRASLTPEQVRDLPMGELLARVNGRLDTIDTETEQWAGIDTSRFIGYVVDRRISGITVYTAKNASDDARDVYVRYLITQALGLPTHLFPDVFEATIYSGADVEAALA